jgi:hypothetical protein
MSKASSTETVNLGARFDEVRRHLLQDEYADRLTRPLEFWVLPSDRRLPLALLNRTLRDLLTTPFEELSATPGIGQKKINSLVKLLDRATKDEPPLVRVGGEFDERRSQLVRGNSAPDLTVFDPAIVSEALWAEWCQSVRRYGVGHETLGRLAPSLQRLPTVIWHTPLSHYLDHTVAEIRRLRTHGEKRVRCVLEVFHSVYHRLQSLDPQDDLYRRLTPSWVRQVQTWVQQRLANSELPTAEEVRAQFVDPLVDLISTDCGSTVEHLIVDRLGLNGESLSVREQARQLGVTRARVYQLLDDCGRVLAVRWPEGQQAIDQLSDHFTELEGDHQSLRLFFSLSEFCFPTKHAAASEASEQDVAEFAGVAEASDAGVQSGIQGGWNGDGGSGRAAGAGGERAEPSSSASSARPREESREASLVGRINAPDSGKVGSPRATISSSN